jgi:hypothetical protein
MAYQAPQQKIETTALCQPGKDTNGDESNTCSTSPVHMMPVLLQPSAPPTLRALAMP